MKNVFLLAAKAGSLEGYLYQRTKLDNLDNWVDNIIAMYGKLPAGAKAAIKAELELVLTRALSYGEKTLEPALKAKLNGLLTSVRS